MLHPAMDSALRWLHGIAAQSAYKDVFWSLSLVACAFIALQINARRLRSKPSLSVEQKRQAKATFRNAMIFLAGSASSGAAKSARSSSLWRPSPPPS